MKNSKYEGYAVGSRVLRIVPGWLLLSLVAFVLIFLLFGWLSRPVGKTGEADEVFKNEAMNQTPSTTTTRDTREAGQNLKRPAAPSVDEAAGAQETAAARATQDAGDAAGFSVQTGSFDERSQANEQISRLRAAGFEAWIVEKGKEKTEGVWFQVRCGRFATREEAAQLAAQLRAKRLAAETVIIEPVRE